jgi:hypothetical protein
MRIIGNRRSRPIGLFGPTDDEIRASVESSKLAPRVVPKGVYRYRTHAEANAAADQWAADGLVQRALEMRSAPCEVSRLRAVIGRFSAKNSHFVGLVRLPPGVGFRGRTFPGIGFSAPMFLESRLNDPNRLASHQGTIYARWCCTVGSVEGPAAFRRGDLKTGCRFGFDLSLDRKNLNISKAVFSFHSSPFWFHRSQQLIFLA